MNCKVDFEVVSQAGVTVATFQSDDMAKAWAAARKDLMPGLVVEKVTTTVERERVYRPRAALKVAA